ncbi:unnamed protein product [Ranitomeya imitator]|uniref:Methylosome subunit pICln n=1 Tax=Ranitomeya imitator TaxID=111125 RepID=A0ABN9MPW7_9NEOB|nr:unnamed protein product [Ranitomeya imitator]
MLGVLSSFPPPEDEEDVRRLQPRTEAVWGGHRLGTGTLYINISRLSWLNSSGLGFSLEYPSISLHAISRDTATYPEEHIYVMVDGKMVNGKVADGDGNEANMNNQGEDNEEEDDDDNDEEPITEIRFVPENKADCRHLFGGFGLCGVFLSLYSVSCALISVEEMFNAMCYCQAFHPDPDDEYSDDDFEGEEYDVEAHGVITTEDGLIAGDLIENQIEIRPDITAAEEERVHIPLELGYVHTVRIWLRIRSGLAAGDSQQCSIRFTVPSKPMENQIRCAHEQGLGDIPTFYTYEEGLSHLTSEGQATLERLEGMLATSVSNQHTMAGVRTEGSAVDYEDGMDVEAAPTEAGQFEDADVDH